MCFMMKGCEGLSLVLASADGLGCLPTLEGKEQGSSSLHHLGVMRIHQPGLASSAGFPQPSAMQRCRFLLAAGQDGFFGACHYVWLSPRSAYNKREPETLPRARQTPAGRWGPRSRAGSTLPRGPVPFPSQAQTQTRASSPRDAEPDRRVGGCSTCIPSQAAALSRETKASFL